MYQKFGKKMMTLFRHKRIINSSIYQLSTIDVHLVDIMDTSTVAQPRLCFREDLNNEHFNKKNEIYLKHCRKREFQ